MPLIDMPLEKLRLYKGSSPRPADFDKFWDKSVRDMKSVDPDVKLVRQKYPARNAECFDMYFTGVEGARIYAKFLRPSKIRDKCPVVLLFHGYTGNCGDWFDKLAWVSEGYIVAAMDCRGQNGKSQDIGGVAGNTVNGHIIRGLGDLPEKLLFRNIFLDCAELAGIVMGMPEVDENRVYATGGSQGGGLTLACGALEPRVKKCASTFPFLCDYKRVWEMDLAKNAYDELTKYFRSYDPLHSREDEIFEMLGYIDVQNLVPRIKAEVLMNVGLMDIICPPSSQFAAYNKIRSKKRMIIYPDFGHEGMPGLSDSILEFLSGR